MRERMQRLFRPFDEEFKDARARNAFRAAFGITLFLFPFSLMFVPFRLLPDTVAWMSSASIALYGLALWLSETRIGGRAATLRFGLISLVYFSVEWIGKSTGFPFGDYAYTDTLAPLLSGVPLAMAFAWYTVLVGAWRMARRVAGTRANLALIALITGALATALDLLLEPMAAFVHSYWTWSGGSVPAQNYLAWFVLSTAGAAVLQVTTKPDADRIVHAPVERTASAIYSMQAAVFAFTALVHGYVAETFVAAAIITPALFLVVRSERRDGREGVSTA